MPVQRTHEEYQKRKATDAFRSDTINELIGELTSADEFRLKDMVRDIINEHVKLTGTDGFYHNGRVYTNMTGVPFGSLQKVPIAPSLKPRILEYNKQCNDLDRDRAAIKQGLAVLIRNCETIQAVRNALPEVLIPIMKDIRYKATLRTMPEGHTLTSKLHQKQFEKTMDRVYFYLGSRLLG